VNRCMLWIQRCLALGHLGCGLLLVLGAAWYAAFLFGVHPPAPRIGPWLILLGFVFLGPTLTVVPQAALGAWMVVLARWLWFGHQRLRAALLLTHGFFLMLGSFFIVVGFHAVAAAERSTARGGGLLSPIAFLPFLYGVPMAVFAGCSVAIALVAVPRKYSEPR